MQNVLFIGLSYYNYTDEIISTLRDKGYNVVYYPIEPRTLKFKALRYISNKLYRKAIDKYHLSIIEKEKNNNYEFVFFLTVHFFSFENLESLKQSHQNAHFALYNWDTITVYNYTPFIKYFDEVYTFDPNDAKSLSVNYLPLFCIDELFNVSKTKPHQYDIYIVGSLVTIRRYAIIKEFSEYCKTNKIIFKKHLKCSPVVLFRLLAAGYFPLDISFFSIKRKEFIEYVELSKAVFDFSNHIQNGYTMRVIENLCGGKKIITNNTNIVNESFYSPDRVLVFKNFDFTEVADFLTVKVVEPEKEFHDLSIKNWANVIFSKTEN